MSIGTEYITRNMKLSSLFHQSQLDKQICTFRLLLSSICLVLLSSYEVYSQNHTFNQPHLTGGGLAQVTSAAVRTDFVHAKTSCNSFNKIMSRPVAVSRNFCQRVNEPSRSSEAVVHTNDRTLRNQNSASDSKFYIVSTPSAAACQSFLEEVVWNTGELENLEVNGNSLEKVRSKRKWNGGATSLNRVHDNGHFQFVTSETNRRKAVGLSEVNVDGDFKTIDYAFILEANEDLQIYENGSQKGNFGSYFTGDTLKIAVKNGTVHYYRNNELLRVATTVPSLPLLVDVSIRDLGGTVNEAVIANLGGGSFSASAESAGPSAIYRWFLNGKSVWINSSTFASTKIVGGDVVTCQLTPNSENGGGLSYLSNSIESVAVDQLEPSTFFISGKMASSALYNVSEDVVWDRVNLKNVKASSNNLTKIQSKGNWNGGAASLNSVKDNGYFEFIATETNRKRAVGLSGSNINSNFTTIDYAFYLEANGNLKICESGNNRGNYGSYFTGDTLRISVENGSIRYFRNRELLRIASTAPSLPLFVDVSIRDIDGTISDAVIVNNSDGSFTASADIVGSNPTYQWFLNGVAVGANSNTYSNSDIQSGDEVFCELYPDLGGCAETTYTSNKVKLLKIRHAGPSSLFVSTTHP